MRITFAVALALCALQLAACAELAPRSSTTPRAPTRQPAACKGCPPNGFGNIEVRDANGVTRTYKTTVDIDNVQTSHVIVDDMPAVTVGTVAQGNTNASHAQAWKVQLSDGTNPLGTAGNPVRTSPATSPTNQPVIGAAASGSAVSGNPVLQAGSDGTNARTIATDTSGRQIAVGAAASGSAVAGSPVLVAGSDGTNARSLSTDSSGRLNINIISGAGTSSTVGSAVPSTATASGFSDGTNMRLGRVFDLDTTGATEYNIGVNLRTSSGAGSLELGTLGTPLRIDPVGTSLQPISGQALAGVGVSGGPVRIGANDSGTTRDLISDSSGRLLLAGAAASGSAVAGNPVLTAGSDGTNARTLKVDSSGYLGVNIISGAGSGGTSSTVGAAVPSTATAVGLSDGTNMQLGHAFDLDSGGGTEYNQGFTLRLAGSGGSVAGGTTSNPVIVGGPGTAGTPAGGVLSVQGVTSMTALKVDASATTQPVSSATFATVAKQPALGTAGTASSDVLTVQGIASMTALKVDGSAVTQPTSNTVTSDASWVSAQASNATFTSSAADWSKCKTLWILATMDGTSSPAGNFTVLTSIDNSDFTPQLYFDANKVYGSTNGAVYTHTGGATVTISGASASAFNIPIVDPPRYGKLVFTRTSGGTTGSRLNAQWFCRSQ